MAVAVPRAAGAAPSERAVAFNGSAMGPEEEGSVAIGMRAESTSVDDQSVVLYSIRLHGANASTMAAMAEVNSSHAERATGSELRVTLPVLHQMRVCRPTGRDRRARDAWRRNTAGNSSACGTA